MVRFGVGLVAERQLIELFPQNFEHLFLALLVALLAARFYVQLVDGPVGEVVAEGQHAGRLVDHVQLAGAVEVDDGAERARMAVEEELGRRRRQVEVVADAGQLGSAAAGHQSAEPGARQAGQRPPRYLVPYAAHVEDDPPAGRRDDHQRRRRRSGLGRWRRR